MWVYFIRKGVFNLLEIVLKNYSRFIQPVKGVKGIAEKPEQYLPMLADIDLKLEVLDETITRLYTRE